MRYLSQLLIGLSLTAAAFFGTALCAAAEVSLSRVDTQFIALAPGGQATLSDPARESMYAQNLYYVNFSINQSTFAQAEAKIRTFLTAIAVLPPFRRFCSESCSLGVPCAPPQEKLQFCQHQSSRIR